MPEQSLAPITIQLSEFQQATFAEIADEEKRGVAIIEGARSMRNAAVFAIIGATHDPKTLLKWAVEVKESAIVATPPAPAPENVPE